MAPASWCVFGQSYDHTTLAKPAFIREANLEVGT